MTLMSVTFGVFLLVVCPGQALNLRIGTRLHHPQLLQLRSESTSVSSAGSAELESSSLTESPVEEETPLTEKELEIQRLRAAEKFIVEETGLYECKVCGYTYDENAQGTSFLSLSNSWRCPQCLSQKGVFKSQTQTIAGFKENQEYGFGTNSMTGETKNSLIFGSLALFAILFLSGYLLE